MAASPDLTILLVTMDRRDLLEMALWYLWETCAIGVEADLWVWDNASTDDTPEFLGTIAGWPGVRVFRSKENVGLVESRRRMLCQVRTPYVFTLDDDVWMINRGWAHGICQAIEALPSVGQIGVHFLYHGTNDYGVVHEGNVRPHFRVPPIAPRVRSVERDFQSPDHAVPASSVTGAEIVDAGGEVVFVPSQGARYLPFSVSGSASAWRTEDVRAIPYREERHRVVDLSEAWGARLQEGGFTNAMVAGYGCLHVSPGPVWHLGRGERYWERRCGFAEAIYGRTAETQRSWLENTRRASGWGRALEDPDEVLR